MGSPTSGATRPIVTPPRSNRNATSVDLSLILPRHPAAAGIARRELARSLGESFGARQGDLELVVSELVNNAFLHGCGDIRIALLLEGGRARGHVVDGGHGFSTTVSARRLAEDGGFGLGIVERLTSRWGVREGTSHVWFEMEFAAESR